MHSDAVLPPQQHSTLHHPSFNRGTQQQQQQQQQQQRQLLHRTNSEDARTRRVASENDATLRTADSWGDTSQWRVPPKQPLDSVNGQSSNGSSSNRSSSSSASLRGVLRHTHRKCNSDQPQQQRGAPKHRNSRLPLSVTFNQSVRMVLIPPRKEVSCVYMKHITLHQGVYHYVQYKLRNILRSACVGVLALVARTGI
jgi:hypothetical protein